MYSPPDIRHRPAGPVSIDRDAARDRQPLSGIGPVIRKDAPLIRVIAVLSDCYLLVIAALFVYTFVDRTASITPFWKALDAAVFISLSLAGLYIFGLYERAERMRPLESLYRAFKGFALAAAASLAVFYALGQDGLGGAPVILLGALSWLAVGLWHGLGQEVLHYYAASRPVMIIADDGEEARELARGLADGANPAYRLAGRLAPGTLAAEARQPVARSPGLVAVSESMFSREGGSRMAQLSGSGREVIRLSYLYEIVLGRFPLSQAVLLPALKRRQGVMYRFASRALDLTVSLAGLLFMLLILAPVAAAVKLSSPGPVFYRQERIGRQGKRFRLIKFRTMRMNPESGAPRWPFADERRITRVGRFLRRTHLDEVPQFLNVLKGDLALVGPRTERPEVEELIKRQLPFFSLRHMARPGITGWAQVMGGYPCGLDDMREKLQHDLFYIKNRCFFLDLVILVKTARAVFQLNGR